METENSQLKQNPAARGPAAVFGTFLIDGTELTLPVDSIQEVVNYPARITEVPLAPAFLLGIFNLRGTIVPVINLRQLLKFADARPEAHHKIAIIDLDGVKAGLLFDSTGEILHVRDDQKSEFEYEARADSTPAKGAIRGVLKLDDGNRIVQILDPSALLRIQNLPQILDRIGAGNPRVDREASVRGPRRQGISFWAGQTQLALEIGAIQEIIKVPDLQKSVVSEEKCLGMANLRGCLVPILDFVQHLGFRDGSPRVPADERIVVIRAGEWTVGLLIDRVENIVSFYKDEVLAIPLLNEGRAELFDGLISRPAGHGAAGEGRANDMILLHAEGVASDPAIADLVASHAKLFAGKRDAAAAKKRVAGQRRVCIAFQLERAFALPIHQIREIINYSADTIRPPGLPSQIRGVLNLRGQAVTIVDLRTLYGLEPFADVTTAKVLVVEQADARYGLLVDGVEDIVSFFDDQRLELPKALLRENPDQFENEVKEILEIAGHEGQRKKCLMILDLDKVLGRIATVLKAA
jgi:purine-binding chemotaxis protein CheW